MNFQLSKEQITLCDQIKSFSQTTLGKDLASKDAASEFDPEDWNACAKQGVFGLNTPKELGGSGHDMQTSVKMLEALGYGCRDNGLTLAINGQVWCVQAPILKFGSDFQREKYVKGMVDGSMIGAHAMTEAEAGSDAFSMKSTAEKTDGGYILNGRKIYVGMAGWRQLPIAFWCSFPLTLHAVGGEFLLLSSMPNLREWFFIRRRKRWG